jgi:hypothetical protein
MKEKKLSKVTIGSYAMSYGSGYQIMGSSDGTLSGEWVHAAEPIFYGGGHGMIFSDKTGKKYLTFHAPNEFLKEKPIFQPLYE